MNPVHAYRNLCAFAERGSRWFGVLVWGFLALIASAILAISGGRGEGMDRASGAFAVMGFLSIGNGIAWLYYPNRGLRLMRDARKMAMPSIAREVLSALGLLFMVTVALPAAFLAWYFDAHFPALLGLLACAAFAGMLLTLMNLWMMLVAFAVGYAAHLMLTYFPVAMPQLSIEDPFVGWLCLAAAVILGALCALRWMYLQSNANASFFFIGRDSFDSTQGRRGPRLETAGPHDPAYAMTVWLGPPQETQTWRRFFGYFRVLGLNALIFGYIFTRMSVVPLYGLCLIFGSNLLSEAGPRWRLFFSKGNGAFADLALVPGWGTTRLARRALLSAALKPVFEQLLVAITCSTLTALSLGMSIAAYPVILGLGLVVGSTCVASSLNVIADKESTRDRLLAVAAPLFLALLFIARIWAYRRGPFGMGSALILSGCCLVWSAVMVWIAVQAYRRLEAQVHPFLMP